MARRELADAYLSFLYTDEAQRLEAQNFYRPVNRDIQKEYEASSDSRNIKGNPFQRQMDCQGH